MGNHCINCNAEVAATDKFCPACGKPVIMVAEPASGTKEKVIHSAGNYSGTMKKGKGRKARKIFFTILLIIVLGGIGYLIYWFNTDPKASEKLINVVGGFVIMGVLFGIGYLTSRKRRNSGDDSSWDSDDNNYNDDRD